MPSSSIFISHMNISLPQLLRLSPAIQNTFFRHRHRHHCQPFTTPTTTTKHVRRRRTAPLTTNALPDYKIARKPLELSIAEASRFPWRDEFEVARDVYLNAEGIINALGPFMTEERLSRIERVCANRTFDVLPIVEHPYDLGNLAAVCRSADALGCGAVHVIRNMEDDRYKQSTRTSGGAEKWLDVQVHASTKECLTQVKQLGYQVVATHLRADAVGPSEIDWTKPTAIVFGNELKGVSDDVLEAADACVAIPMDGFVESFNISVAAALILWEARRVRQQQLGHHGDLSPTEINILKAVLVLRTRGRAKEWITHVLQTTPPEWQQHRNKGNWGGKEFAGGSNGVVTTKEDRRKCFYWDGACCWGEKIIFPGKLCRFHGAHADGVSSINVAKLAEGCSRVGVEIPEELKHLKVRLMQQRQGVDEEGEEESDEAVVDSAVDTVLV